MLAAIAEPGVFPWLCLVLGLLVGSFLNVVIHRLPVMLQRDWRGQSLEVLGEWAQDANAPEDLRTIAPSLERLAAAPAPRYNLLVPGSACPHCRSAIGALQNIPVLSYLLQRGRCRNCSAAIGLRYPVVEAITGIISAVVGWHFGFTWVAAAALLFCWAMIAASAIDLDTQLLPDDITLPLLWAGLLFNVSGTFVPLSSAVIGAVAGYLSLWSVYWVFKLITGKEGMGYGDFKLLAAIGAFLGWKMLPATILLSSMVGAVVGIAMITVAGRDRQIPIPFGPYLAAAGALALFFGQRINQAYMPWL